MASDERQVTCACPRRAAMDCITARDPMARKERERYLDGEAGESPEPCDCPCHDKDSEDEES